MTKKIYAVTFEVEAQIINGLGIKTQTLVIRGDSFDDVYRIAHDDIRTRFPLSEKYYNHTVGFAEVPLQWCIEAVLANSVTDIN